MERKNYFNLYNRKKKKDIILVKRKGRINMVNKKEFLGKGETGVLTVFGFLALVMFFINTLYFIFKYFWFCVTIMVILSIIPVTGYFLKKIFNIKDMGSLELGLVAILGPIFGTALLFGPAVCAFTVAGTNGIIALVLAMEVLMVIFVISGLRSWFKEK